MMVVPIKIQKNYFISQIINGILFGYLTMLYQLQWLFNMKQDHEV